MHVVAGLVWLSVIVVLGATAEEGRQPNEPLVVGVLRADGAIVPYASYFEREWRRLPTDSVPTAEPLAHRRWYHVRPGGLARLNGGGIVRFTGSHTWYETWGVSSDVPARSVDPNAFPMARLGAVLSQPAAAAAFEDARADNAQLLEVLRPLFERLETRQLSVAPRIGHPESPITRASRPIRPNASYRTRLGDQVCLYYVEFRREYAPVTRGMTLYRPLSVLSAWLLKRDTHWKVAVAELQLDSGSEMEISTTHPFAAVRLDGRDYVLCERGGYESVERTVLEVTETITRVLPETQ